MLAVDTQKSNIYTDSDIYLVVYICGGGESKSDFALNLLNY